MLSVAISMYRIDSGPVADESPAGVKQRGRSDRISDPKIRTSIEIIICTAYPGQVRETNGVDPQNIPMPSRPNWILLMVGYYATE